jgi:serine/threonine-protein kinase
MNIPAQPDPWIGHNIGDRQRYRLEKRLGSGGMGDVFLAMDTLLGQQVALKLLKDRLIASSSLIKRFEHEVAICAALKSDHIVNVSDYGVTADGHPFYVMEYLRGQTLKQLLQQQQRLGVERTASIITQVCEGLRLAHQGVSLWWNGAAASEHVTVVHRDLKPDNIFLVPTALGELAKILDFGIAKIRDESMEQASLTLGFIGTFRYAAPEQLRVANNLDERADIYSLGIILYEMLSGTDPFGFGVKAQIATGMSWAMAHRTKPPVPLRSQPGCEHLSSQLEAVVMRCLQKAPDERFASVEELNRALQVAVRLGGSEEDSADTQLQNSIRQRLSHVISPPGKDSDNTKVNQLPTAIRQEISETTIAQTPPLLKSEPKTLSAEVANPTSSQISTPSELKTRSLPTHVLFFLGTGIGFSLTAIALVLAYFQLQSGEIQVLDEIKTLHIEAKYQDCITKAETVAPNSKLYGNVQRLLNQCQVEYAKQLATRNNFAEAIAVAHKIPNNSLLYPQAQALIKEWSSGLSPE